jgi:hypothetical protein
VPSEFGSMRTSGFVPPPNLCGHRDRATAIFPAS